MTTSRFARQHPVYAEQLAMIRASFHQGRNSGGGASVPWTHPPSPRRAVDETTALQDDLMRVCDQLEALRMRDASGPASPRTCRHECTHTHATSDAEDCAGEEALEERYDAFRERIQRGEIGGVGAWNVDVSTVAVCVRAAEEHARWMGSRIPDAAQRAHILAPRLATAALLLRKCRAPKDAELVRYARCTTRSHLPAVSKRQTDLPPRYGRAALLAYGVFTEESVAAPDLGSRTLFIAALCCWEALATCLTCDQRARHLLPAVAALMQRDAAATLLHVQRDVGRLDVPSPPSGTETPTASGASVATTAPRA